MLVDSFQFGDRHSFASSGHQPIPYHHHRKNVHLQIHPRLSNNRTRSLRSTTRLPRLTHNNRQPRPQPFRQHQRSFTRRSRNQCSRTPQQDPSQRPSAHRRLARGIQVLRRQTEQNPQQSRSSDSPRGSWWSAAGEPPDRHL